MEALLIMMLFGATALSLYCIASEKLKLAGGLNVISLCLIVAVAYQFNLMKTILWVVIGIVIILVAVLLFMRKHQKNKNNKVIEYEGE